MKSLRLSVLFAVMSVIGAYAAAKVDSTVIPTNDTVTIPIVIDSTVIIPVDSPVVVVDTSVVKGNDSTAWYDTNFYTDSVLDYGLLDSSVGSYFDTVVVTNWSQTNGMITVYDSSIQQSTDLQYIRGDIMYWVGSTAIVHATADQKSVVLTHVATHSPLVSMIQAVPVKNAPTAISSHASMKISGISAVVSGHFLNLSLAGNGNCSLKLFSISGRCVGSFNRNMSGSARVDLGAMGLGKGMYVLKINAGSISKVLPININN